MFGATLVAIGLGLGLGVCGCGAGETGPAGPPGRNCDACSTAIYVGTVEQSGICEIDVPEVLGCSAVAVDVYVTPGEQDVEAGLWLPIDSVPGLSWVLDCGDGKVWIIGMRSGAWYRVVVSWCGGGTDGGN